MGSTVSKLVFKEAFRLLCGQQIGVGQSRIVYDSPMLRGMVIKVEAGAQNFQNVLEYEAWCRVRGTEFEKWFAPVEYISPSGLVLVMRKTASIPAEQYPIKMPKFFTDFKRSNYGLLNGQVVCHDYGTSLLFEHGMTKAMKTVEWWDS